ncbi:MAG: 5-(carboxyamino)imidazole ribonucleotide mutase [FCB group bacterium]|jgi:5-(carboxyamino)imidazole ribonucleotide mutase|nr:5-(carboxyamino)imidazole ribonucleotide mutase [FCB group bacterium]
MATDPQVAVVMGSKSDWETMRHVCETLAEFGINCDARVLSAHRTPAALVDFVNGAEARGIRIFVAGAGGAAHLAGVVAAHTLLPVIGVPIESASLKGLDSLLSIVQMPGGIPVSTMAIGKAGAVNAGLTAVSILALGNPELTQKLQKYRDDRAKKILSETLP